ncbi:membrane-spanning 4-domains subfamily A member 14 [Meles meles]|uniref:membrane-spanning 4-domains subfamily A member 14 n=1 Tax=Meles meles TaxID=9662 RepID=UPI001E69EBAE|nr:membrane-spanning 4-domains subfamily A member 14 [Meles meles]
MESSSEIKRSTHHVITVQPNDKVLTAFPYGPHASLLDFLKGEPKVLGAIQILLALIILGIGTIFAFNYISFSQKFPLVFLTGYPFWGAFVGQCVMAMNVISSLVAVAGITLTIISYRYQHKYCQMPSLEGICVIGRVLFNGILSVLLIISIVELSIAVTIASFRNECWTNSDEIVFFLPSDITEDSEISTPEENATIQFELQEESSTDISTKNKQPVFIGGYAFFKLRISRNPLVFQHSRRRGSSIYYTSSASMLDEQYKNNPPPSQLQEEQTKLKVLPLTSEKPTENIQYTEQLKDEDLKSAVTQPPKKQTQLLQSSASPIQVFPSYSKKLQALPPKDLLPQALPVQAPKPYVTQPHGLTSEDMPYQDVSSQDAQSLDLPPQKIPYQDISYQNPPYQDTPSKNMASQDMISPYTPAQGITNQDLISQVPALPAQLFEAPTFHAVQSSNIQRLDQQSLQQQNQQFMQVAYQDMQSEVKLLTQEWKSKEEFHSRKSSKWQALDWLNKNSQPPKSHNLEQQDKALQNAKQKSPDPQIQGQQSPKRKSLDEHIKGWLSPKRHSTDKQIQVNQDRQQYPDQQSEGQLVLWEQPQKQLSPYGQDEDQQDKEKQSLKKQYKDRQERALQVYKGQSLVKHTQQAEDLQVKEQLHQDGQFQIQEYQGWQFLDQKSQDWSSRVQGWRSKDWKVQEVQLEMPRSLKWESQIRQTQDLREEESLKQTALQQEVQAVHAITRQQLQSIPFQDSQDQDKNQQDHKSTDTRKEDMQIDTMQTRDNKPTSMKYESQNLYNLQLEDKKPDFKCSSSGQSSVQDTQFSSASDINSEQDVQKDISICSASYQEDIPLTSTSCYTKDQQQSEDSD